MTHITMPEWNVLTVIQRHIRQHGQAPRLQDIADQCGWRSKWAARVHLDRLEAKGIISRKRYSSRTIRVHPADVAVLP